MSNELETIPTPDSSMPNPDSQIIDAEFEVKSEGNKTEAEPVRISPEEQEKLDQAFREAEKKQAQEDSAQIKNLKDFLEKSFREGGQKESVDRERRKKGKTKSEDEDFSSADDYKVETGKQDSSESERKEWIEELRNRIQEQKDVINDDRGKLEKTQKELEAIENRPWYKSVLAGDPFGLIDSPKKGEEVEARKHHLQKLNDYLFSLENQLEKAIKNDPSQGWR